MVSRCGALIVEEGDTCRLLVGGRIFAVRMKSQGCVSFVFPERNRSYPLYRDTCSRRYTPGKHTHRKLPFWRENQFLQPFNPTSCLLLFPLSLRWRFSGPEDHHLHQSGHPSQAQIAQRTFENGSKVAEVSLGG